MSLVIYYDLDFPILHHPHARIRGSEVDANDYRLDMSAELEKDNEGEHTVTKVFSHRGL